MAYLGRGLDKISNVEVLDNITFDGSSSYTLQKNSVNFIPSSANTLLLSIDGIVQAGNFTVSGSTIDFGTAVAGTSTCNFVLHYGVGLITAPSDATVTTAKLADNNVTTAKLAYNPNPNRNIIINGDMSVAQRGTSFTTASNYTLDRWHLNDGTSGEFTITQSTTVPSGQGFASSYKLDCTTADASPSSSEYLIFNQRIEGQNLQYIKKGTSSAESLTLSFWIRSNKTGDYVTELRDADNTRNNTIKYTISSADTWEKKELTFAGDTTGALDNDNARSFDVNFWLLAGSNYTSGTFSSNTWSSITDANRVVGGTNIADSTSNEWYITGVQLEAGTTASDFEFLPFDINLQRCLRYFQDLAPKKDDCRIAIGENVSGSRCDPVFQYVEKRANPSVTFTAANTFSLYNANTSRDCTSMSSDNFSEICGNLNANVSSGLTPTGGASQFITNGTGSQIFVDAEL